MYNQLRAWALALLKVPPEPHPPFGDPASLRVFNAGRNYFRLRLAGWALTQALALAGFIFWTTLLLDVENQTAAQKGASGSVPRLTNTNAPKSAVEVPASKRRRDTWAKHAGERIGRATVEPGEGRPPEDGETDHGLKRRPTRIHPWGGFRQACIELAAILPSGAFLLIWTLKILSFLAYAVQIPLTYAILRLDYEMRWYMVTDRSLRIRSGVWRVSEATMSFANIQQVLVSQGPLQRLLGLANVQVKSAGGGSGGHYDRQSADMHTGLFQNVTNAEEIRDLILERLRRFRQAGLGDPEDKHSTERAANAPTRPAGSMPAEVLLAARELAAEARALRAGWKRPG